MEKQYKYIKTDSIYDLLIHVGIVISITAVIVLYFFNSFLPNITNLGETVTVPDLEGMNVEEMQKFLDSRDLEYIISDSSYSPRHKPFVVLTQSPEPGAKVKRGRRLQITINPKEPPKIKIPDLIDMPFSEARRTLKNADLKLGRTRFKPHIAENVVLEISINGKTYTAENRAQISAGVMIPKGTAIHLMIGDGVGDTEFPVPDLVMMPLDEAEFVVKAQDLVLGNIQYVFNSSHEIGTVVKQSPPPYLGRLKKGVEQGSVMDNRERNEIRAGEIIDLWVVGNPAAEPLEEEELTEEEKRIRDSLNTPLNIRRKEDLERYQDKQLGKEKKPKPKKEKVEEETDKQ